MKLIVNINDQETTLALFGESLQWCYIYPLIGIAKYCTEYDIDCDECVYNSSNWSSLNHPSNILPMTVENYLENCVC